MDTGSTSLQAKAALTGVKWLGPALALAMSCTATMPVRAQEGEPPPVVSKEDAERARITTALYAEDLRYRRAQIDQAVKEDQHRMFSFYKQSVTDIVIGIFVMLTVLSGIYMSYLQFRKSGPTGTGNDGGGASEAGGVSGENPVAPAGMSRLKFGFDGVEISSSIIGLFVLVASMFFFYLYIDRVYEIKVLAPVGAAKSTS